MLDSEQTKREKIKEFRLLTDVPDHHDTEAFLLQRGWNLQRALNDFFDENRDREQIALPLAGSYTNSSESSSSASGTRTRHYHTVRSRVVTDNSSSIWQRIEENRKGIDALKVFFFRIYPEIPY